DRISHHGKLCENAIGTGVAGTAAVPHCKAAAIGAGGGAHEQSARVRCPQSDDVDDNVDGIGAPDRGARTADHFDAIDIFEHEVFGIPQHTREQRVVDRPAVHEHEQL